MCGLEERVPQQTQGHARIGAGSKRRTFGPTGGQQLGKDRKLGFYGGAHIADVLPGRPRVQAAQGRAGRVGESRTSVSPSFQELYQSLAPEGTARDEMLRQHPFGIWPPCPARRSTNDRSHTENTPHTVASDATAYRVGMELKRVAIPAKGAAETDYGYLDEGDEVLKCFNLSRYATLFGFAAWAFENPPRHADAHAHCPANSHGGRWGKLPWRKMLRYSGRLGKKAEKATGGEHDSRSSGRTITVARERPVVHPRVIVVISKKMLPTPKRIEPKTRAQISLRTIPQIPTRHRKAIMIPVGSIFARRQ